MRVLGIESSCDETAVALYDDQHGLLNHIIHSQTLTHAAFGGVVPELAARDHIRYLLPMLRDLLTPSSTRDHSSTPVDGIAYTQGPGLAGALLVGSVIARTLGWAWQKPTVGVHHLEGHILAPFLEPRAPSFPFLALLVSGGHTELIVARALGDYQVIGRTVDDAAGEAFDKIAKLLGLGYPGGAALADLALRGHAQRFTFPRPMLQQATLNFSFSGLKTAAAYTIMHTPLDEQIKADIAYAFQEAVVATLLHQCRRALRQTHLQHFVVAGGVGANQALRSALQDLRQHHGVQYYFPRLEFCTDNAAMIAYTGCQYLRRGHCHQDFHLTIHPRWPLREGQPL